MFRAGDCPYEFVTNRVRTLDIRLLCGSTAVHSDMLMWHKDETPEVVALQFINILFSVPQISILLDQLPASHLAVVRFWLSFWREHRDVLLDGKLMPLHPESSYPVVLASTPSKQIITAYLDTVLQPIGEVPPHLLIVNGTLAQRLILELPASIDERSIDIFDCQGNLVRSETLHLTAGIHRLAIPPAGVISLRTH
jgi:alpha-galactosidase